MSRATCAAVAVVSAAILAYQVLLMRLFSIVSWHHFAYMIISIALLGFGASGTALAITQRKLLPRFHAFFAASAALFAVTTIASFAVAIRLPFNPLAIVWDVRQLFWLTLSYALLVLPFFFGGGAIGLAFSRYRHEVGLLYAFDLVGAGIGALGVVGVLFLLSPASTLCVIGALGLFAATLVLLPGAGRRRSRLAATGLGVAAAVVTLWLPSSLISLHQHVSEYKGLVMALRVPGARIIEERSSPLGLISIVESPTIPFRHAPGLSLNNTVEPPLQLGMFTDAEALGLEHQRLRLGDRCDPGDTAGHSIRFRGAGDDCDHALSHHAADVADERTRSIVAGKCPTGTRGRLLSNFIQRRSRKCGDGNGGFRRI